MEDQSVGMLKDIQYALFELETQKNILDNLLFIQKHVMEYGITKENTALFAQSFEAVGWDYSVEGIVSKAAEAVWNFVKKIATFIKDKCIALFDKLIQLFQKLFSKDTGSVPPDKKDEFNRLMVREPSTEANDTPIIMHDLDRAKIIHADGSVLGVDGLGDFLIKTTDCCFNLVHAIKTNAPKSRLEQIDKEFNQVLYFSAETFPGCYEAGWGDGYKLKRLQKAALSTKGTLKNLHQELASLLSDSVAVNNEHFTEDQLRELSSWIHWLTRITSRVYIVIQRAFKVKTDLCDIGKKDKTNK